MTAEFFKGVRFDFQTLFFHTRHPAFLSGANRNVRIAAQIEMSGPRALTSGTWDGKVLELCQA